MPRAYEYPRYPRSRVDRAGERIRTSAETPEDLEVIENWRASHAAVLGSFRKILYNKARNFAGIHIVQRLKRKPSIVAKLDREPKMRLSRMHDIAGCRVIFPDLKTLHEFRAEMHSGGYRHQRRGANDDRWNYISKPKPNGYRGIHDVYAYSAEAKKGRQDEAGLRNGMLIEIQYRTKIQHAWAAAVELAGLVTENNPKFGRGSQDFIEYFKLSSEMMARELEGMESCYPNYASIDLTNYLIEADMGTHITSIFSELREKEGVVSLNKASLLIFRYDPSSYEEQLEIRSYKSMSTAIKEYGRLEKSLLDSADIVLVGSRSGESIRSAYSNYFLDATEFMSLLGDAEELTDKRAHEEGWYGPDAVWSAN